ncbi:MAG: methyltransferase domain-containing protein, partial [Cyanobium sp. ELA507]
MDRIPEPELMDELLQARAYAAADFSRPDQALVDAALERFGAAGLGPRLVDLGCGPGNITFRLAAACPAAAVLGLDGAGAMLAIAEGLRRADPQRWRQVAFRLARLPLDWLEEAVFAPLPLARHQDGGVRAGALLQDGFPVDILKAAHLRPHDLGHFEHALHVHE